MNTQVAIVCQALFYLLEGCTVCYACHVFLHCKKQWAHKIVYVGIVFLYPLTQMIPVVEQYSYDVMLMIGLLFGVLCHTDCLYKRLLIPLIFQEFIYSFHLFSLTVLVYLYQHGVISAQDSALALFLSMMICIITMCLIRKKRQSLPDLNQKEWKVLFLLGCFYQILLLLNTYSLTKHHMEITYEFFIQELMMLSFYFLFLYFYVSMIKIKKKEFLDQINGLNERLCNMMDKQLKDSYEDNRKIRHDLKNHIVILQQYLNHHQIEAAKEYLKKINRMIGEADVIYTENEALNYILNTKIMRMKEEQKKISVKIYDSLNFLDPFDIATIFGNLLDNALENCDTPGWIDLWIGRRMDEVVIEIKNSCSEVPVEASMSISKKGEGHGFGISSVIACVNRNKGHYQ